MKRQILWLLVLTFIGCENNTVVREQVILWNGKDFSGWSFFLKDSSAVADSVWSVRDGAIYCSGDPFGYMKTMDSFSDYKLVVEWRWAGDAGNSGVFIHAEDEDKIWPVCVECQLKAGHAGDFVIFDGASCYEQGDPAKRVIKKQAESSEKPAGEWNRYEIVCRDRSVSVKVNDVEQNKITRVSPAAGRICLQSEGAPIMFRHVYLEQF